MTRFITFLIKTYQAFSPFLLPRTCRYHPSCSAYAIQALEKYGLYKGTLKAIVRILRCSPLSNGGYDPLK